MTPTNTTPEAGSAQQVTSDAGSAYPCTLAEAKSRGLEPCGKCVLR